jgi:hypothetical protein
VGGSQVIGGMSLEGKFGPQALPLLFASHPPGGEVWSLFLPIQHLREVFHLRWWPRISSQFCSVPEFLSSSFFFIISISLLIVIFFSEILFLCLLLILWTWFPFFQHIYDSQLKVFV